jgi:hypothetical protein
MITNKIIPCLWFYTKKGDISIVVDYYNTVFENNFKAGRINKLGKTLSGKRNVRLNQVGESYSLISKEKVQDHVLHCK